MAAHTGPDSDYERRLRALEDINAIKELKARYWRAVDFKRPDEVEACFLPDAVIDYEGLPRYETRDDFLAIVRLGVARPAVFDVHHGLNPVIELTGADSARGVWDCLYHGIDAADRLITIQNGAYEDEYARREGRWFIKSTRMRRAAFLLQSVAEDGSIKVLALGEAPHQAVP